MSAIAYSDELAAAICARISGGESLRSICSDDAMPARSTVLAWVRDKKAFRADYEAACLERTNAMAEEILEIADDARNDWMERTGQDDPGWAANGEHLQRCKLRIDARKWLMAKLQPKKYGDRVNLDHSGEIKSGPPIDISKIPVGTRDAVIKALEAQLAQTEAETHPEG